MDEPPTGWRPRCHATTDIANAINKQNALFGAGQIGQQPTDGPVQLTPPVITQEPFSDPAQYEQIILRASQQGSAIVGLAMSPGWRWGWSIVNLLNDRRQPSSPSTCNPAPTAWTFRGSQGNPAGTRSRFPEGLKYTIALDTNGFIGCP